VLLHRIFLPSTFDLQLHAYCDFNWTGCLVTRRSLTGYFITLGCSPISWKTKKQTIISAPQLNIALWLLQLVKLFGFALYYMIWWFLFLHLLSYIVTTMLPFILLLIRCIMNTQSISRSTVTLFRIVSNQGPLLQYTFLLNYSLLTSSPKLSIPINSRFLLASWAFVTSMLQLEGAC